MISKYSARWLHASEESYFTSFDQTNHLQFMKKLLSIILILGALALGYLGYTKMDEGKAEVKIGDLEITAQDDSSKQTAYIYFGLGALCLIAGLIMSRGRS